MSRSVDMQQLAALAAKGVPEAKMLLNMRRHAVQNQDEQDRRWRKLSHAIDQLKAQGKEPQTCKEYLDVIARYGFVSVNRVSAAQKARKMRFDQLMAVCGGFSSSGNDYPAKGEPDAPVKCEGCRNQGADFRCSWCGEWYCSKVCFIKDLRDHMPVCTTAVDNMHCGTPPTPRPELWSPQHYAQVYGLAAPTATATAGSSSSSSSSNATSGSAVQSASQQQQDRAAYVQAAVAGLLGLNLTAGPEQVPQGGKSKSQKRNASRRRKQKEEKAAAAAAAAAGEQQPQQQEEDPGQQQ